MSEPRGRVAIVTGASRGIGKAIALGLASQGYRVAVAARTAEAGKRQGTIHETADEVKALGGEALALPCDVRDEASVQSMVQAVVREWGVLDVLINNAGIGTYTPLLETPTAIWDRIMAVNVRGTFLCSKEVAPLMISRRTGSIVNISSPAANTVFSVTSSDGGKRRLVGIAYGASKAALERMTVGLAAELGRHNIAVNALKPARAVMTESLQTLLPSGDHDKWVGPEGMVRAASFLAAQDASGVTGTVMTDDELLLLHGLS